MRLYKCGASEGRVVILVPPVDFDISDCEKSAVTVDVWFWSSFSVCEQCQLSADWRFRRTLIQLNDSSPPCAYGGVP